MSDTARSRLYRQLYPDQGKGASRSTLLNRLLVLAIVAAIATSILATEPEITGLWPVMRCTPLSNSHVETPKGQRGD